MRTEPKSTRTTFAVGILRPECQAGRHYGEPLDPGPRFHEAGPFWSVMRTCSKCSSTVDPSSFVRRAS